MRRAWRLTIAGLVAVAATGGVAALSRVPYEMDGDGRSVLRLSWRTVGERVQECRRPTPEELQGLPAHMRPKQICEGRVAPYILRAWVDDRLVVDDTVRGAGAREDRPIYVFREIDLTAGSHALRITFERARAEAPEEPDEDRIEEAERTGAAGLEAPRRMELDTDVRATPGTVVLVTYDPSVGRLVVRGQPE